MTLLKLPVLSDAASAELEDWGAVGLPLSEPPCRLRGLKMATAAGGPEMGIWECTPGRYRRQIRSAETMHILSGEAVFTPDGGEPVVLGTGGVFFFPAETLGNWEIRLTVRKLYVLYTPG